ncbi:MAG: hypothetical protein RLZZ303_2333 [Candidatus Hydrogenedentota bacterium]
MTPRELLRARAGLIQLVLAERNLDGVLLNRVDNFAAATGGRRNYINIHSDLGANGLAITREGKVFYIGNNIERPRLEDEELGDIVDGFHDFLWTENTPAGCVREHFTGQWASDDGSLGENIHGALAMARTLLTPLELDRYRALGRLAAEAMEATLAQIAPGTTEADIAAIQVCEGQRRHCQVPVSLVAADDRIAKYRHPLPTLGPLCGDGASQGVRRYVMVVGCFQREGLIVSLTRFKQVAELPRQITDSFARICAVDAAVQEATLPGCTLGNVFTDLQAAYERQGFRENEWHNHHQGGLTGYAGRTAKGTPGSQVPCLDADFAARVSELTGAPVQFGCAFAWNPSAPGVKSEDTFLLHPDGRREIISATPSLPQVDLAALLGHPTDIRKSGIAPA